MKRLLVILVLILSLTSCSKSNEDRLIIGSTYKNNEVIKLDTNSLEDMILNEDDFVLVVESNGCKSCEEFINLVNEFVSKYNADIYSIDYTLISNLFDTPKRYETNPRIILFEDGEIEEQISIKQRKDIFTSYDKLEEYLNNRIVISNMVKITYSDIDELILSNSVIYYGWNKCGDCLYMEEESLDDIIYSNKYNKFYYFNVNDYRIHKDDNTTIWNDFVNKTKININNNGGKVPSIIKYENNEVKDYVIYFNDILEENNGTYKVIQTSYNDNGYIINQTFNSYSEYQKGTEEYHNNKLETFFNKYLYR